MTRTLETIAGEILADWSPAYSAKPYLDALNEMPIPATREAVAKGWFYNDTAKSVILYFLSNAQNWRGETARRIKAELKELAR